MPATHRNGRGRQPPNTPQSQSQGRNPSVPKARGVAGRQPQEEKKRVSEENGGGEREAAPSPSTTQKPGPAGPIRAVSRLIDDANARRLLMRHHRHPTCPIRCMALNERRHGQAQPDRSIGFRHPCLLALRCPAIEPTDLSNPKHAPNFPRLPMPVSAAMRCRAIKQE